MYDDDYLVFTLFSCFLLHLHCVSVSSKSLLSISRRSLSISVQIDVIINKEIKANNAFLVLCLDIIDMFSCFTFGSGWHSMLFLYTQGVLNPLQWGFPRGVSEGCCFLQPAVLKAYTLEPHSVGRTPGGWWFSTGSGPASTVPHGRSGAACRCWLGTWPHDPAVGQHACAG